MNPSSAIQVGYSEQVVWIRVEGRGSFQNSSGVKEFARQMMDRGYRTFVVDLKECSMMDSTFMGTLAGVALRLNQLDPGNPGRVHIINIQERNVDLLRNLGLDQLFDMEGSTVDHSQVPEYQDGLESIGQEDKQKRTETMLDAHQALVEADRGNLPKFKDVLDFLRQDLKKGMSH